MFISKISSHFKTFFSNASKKPIFSAKKTQEINKQSQGRTYHVKNQSRPKNQEQQRSIKPSNDIASFIRMQSAIFHEQRTQLPDYLYKIALLINNQQQYEKYKSFLEQITYKTRKTGSQLTLTTQQLLKILIFMESMQKFDKREKKAGGFQVRMSTFAAQIILNKELSISEAVTLYCLLDSLGYKTLQVVQNLAGFLKHELKNNKVLNIESFLAILDTYFQKSNKTIIENILADQVVSSMKVVCIQKCEDMTLQIQNIRILSELQTWRFYKTDQKKLIELFQVSLSKTKQLLESKSNVQINQMSQKQLYILSQSMNKIHNTFKYNEDIVKNCEQILKYYEKSKKNHSQMQNPIDTIKAINQISITSKLATPQQMIKVLLQKSKQMGNAQILLNFVQKNSQVWNSIQTIPKKQIKYKYQQRQLIQFFFIISCSSFQNISSTSKMYLNSLPFSQISIYEFLNTIAPSNNKSNLFQSIFSSKFQVLSSILVSLPTNNKFQYQQWEIFISYYLKQDKGTKFKCLQLLKRCFLTALESENARKVILLTYFTNLLADNSIEGPKQQLHSFIYQILSQTVNTSKAFHYHCYMRIINNLLASEFLSLQIVESIIKLGKQASLKQLYDNCLLMILFGMFIKANNFKSKFLDEECISKQHNYLSRGFKVLSFKDTQQKNQEQSTNATASFLSAVFMSRMPEIFKRSQQISHFIEKSKSFSDFRLIVNTYLMNQHKCKNKQQRAKLLLINSSLIKKADTFCRQERYKEYISVVRSKLDKIDSQYKHQ